MMMPGWLSDPHCPDTLELLEDPYRHAGYHPWPEVSPANLAFDFLGHIFPDGADPVSFLRPSSCGRSINADGTGVDEESSTNHNPRWSGPFFNRHLIGMGSIYEIRSNWSTYHSLLTLSSPIPRLCLEFATAKESFPCLNDVKAPCPQLVDFWGGRFGWVPVIHLYYLSRIRLALISAYLSVFHNPSALEYAS